MKLELTNEKYLGDGVYIGIDQSGQIILYTRRTNHHNSYFFEELHYIALDFSMIRKLYEYSLDNVYYTK